MKRLMALTLSALSVLSYAQIPDYVPADSLVAWYPLDGDANDVGPNQFVGQLSGTTAYEGHLGNDGGSFWFDGGAFVHSPFSTLSTEQGATYTAWVQRANGPGIGYIVSYGNALGLGQSFCLAEGGSYGLFATAIGSNYDAKSNQYLPLNEWTFVATTILNNEVSIYMNSQVVYHGTIQQPTLQLDGELRIGVNPSGQGEYWVGAIDDVGVWNRVLSAEEIQEVYIGTPPLEGCTDESACNYDVAATLDDESCLYLDACGECGGEGTSGCTDSYACNFDTAAACDDGNCNYSCCPGPGCCDQGLTWNWELSLCQDLNPADTNLDGCVQLNDLLDVLSAYGDCGAEEAPWACGDPLSYQGYDYATVQIGDQCWFAENLRAENYRNGEAIPGGLNGVEWVALVNSNTGAQAVYEEELSNLEVFGRLYNFFAVVDERGICPNQWHVPSDLEFNELIETAGGMDQSGINLKSSTLWPSGANGDDVFGFSVAPGGSYSDGGTFSSLHEKARMWSTDPVHSNAAWGRMFDLSEASFRLDNGNGNGFSVRCLKNAE